jgi:tubulin-specific chaperone E
MDIGERLLVKDKDGYHYCTVRFKGSIEGKVGVWVGVEWDDPARGKNDGSVGNKRYFTCLRTPESGSFLKSDKVKSGISLVDAVLKRYTLGQADLKDMSIETANHRRMAVEFSGIEKMSKHLKHISLITTMTMHEESVARGVCCSGQ